MLTITKTTDCSSITIASDYLEHFKLGTGGVTSVTLYYSVNGATELSHTVLTSEITGDSITLDSDFFLQSETALCDGIYCFRLVTTTGSNITEYGSAFIECSLKCTLAELLWNKPELMLYSKYEAIKAYQGCNACDCTTTYNLYLDLLADLGLGNSPCGCQQ